MKKVLGNNREMPNNNGYVPTWRKFRDDWKWKDIHTRGAWLWMFLEANHHDDDPNPGLKMGELLLSSLTVLAKEGGWKHPMQAKRFLDSCVLEQDIKVLRFCYESVKNSLRITICSYEKYGQVGYGFVKESLSDCDGSENNGSVLKKKEEIKKKKILSSSDDAKTDNSKIYNYFIEQKRLFHKKPEWLPNANQAKMLRSNVKQLLQDYPADEVLSGLKTFLADKGAQKKGLPWKFFMGDPLSWIGRKKAKSQDEKDAEWRAEMEGRTNGPEAV